jgi:hypothetical protein
LQCFYASFISFDPESDPEKIFSMVANISAG